MNQVQAGEQRHRRMIQGRALGFVVLTSWKQSVEAEAMIQEWQQDLSQTMMMNLTCSLQSLWDITASHLISLLVARKLMAAASWPAEAMRRLVLLHKICY